MMKRQESSTELSSESGPSARRLGAQLWIERDDSPERIRRLVATAADIGFNSLRVFMVWPWLEPRPGEWRFALLDSAFDAASEHGLAIKATLGSESKPWHRGASGLVQSQPFMIPSNSYDREGAERYITQCVSRYARHPALGQWILWNEPHNPVRGPRDPLKHHSPRERELWEELLREAFADVEALNSRWHTGYTSFTEVPFADGVVDRDRSAQPFFAFSPWLLDSRLRSIALADELEWIRNVVRTNDPVTPVCINPADLFNNHAVTGHDFELLALTTDVLGGSVHAPWHLGFARPEFVIPLIAAGVSMLRSASGQDRPVELTEMQLGNVYLGATVPGDVDTGRLAASFVAPLLAGAESATGWSLNARLTDAEAGEWSLLDLEDRPTDRSAAITRVAAVMSELDRTLGAWRPAEPDVVVLSDGQSQAVQLLHEWTAGPTEARDAHDTIRGNGLLSCLANSLGVNSTIASAHALNLRSGRTDTVLVASAVLAWDAITGAALVSAARAGATVILDALCGRMDLDGRVHQPGPGHVVEEFGFRFPGLHSSRSGHPMSLDGAPAGSASPVRAELEFANGSDWTADANLRYTADDGPVVFRRRFGAGEVVVFTGVLGSSLLSEDGSVTAVRHVINHALRSRSGRDRRILPLGSATFALTIVGEQGVGAGVFAPPRLARGGRPMRVSVASYPGRQWRDLWSGVLLTPGPGNEVELDADDGIAVLVSA